MSITLNDCEIRKLGTVSLSTLKKKKENLLGNTHSSQIHQSATKMPINPSCSGCTAFLRLPPSYILLRTNGLSHTSKLLFNIIFRKFSFLKTNQCPSANGTRATLSHGSCHHCMRTDGRLVFFLAPEVLLNTCSISSLHFCVFPLTHSSCQCPDCALRRSV